MSSLTIRRLIVWVVSAVLGFITTWLIVTVGLSVVAPSSGTTTLEEYGFGYFIVTAIPIGLVFVIWLDKFMDTRILPD